MLLYRAATFRKPDRSALHASKDESFLHMEGEDGTQQEATFQHTVQQQWLQMGYAPGMSPDPVATPGQEKSGERLTEMDLFMNSQMKQVYVCVYAFACVFVYLCTAVEEGTFFADRWPCFVNTAKISRVMLRTSLLKKLSVLINHQILVSPDHLQ